MARKRYSNTTPRTSSDNPFVSQRAAGSTYFDTQQFEEAVVVDVITNNDHPLYDETAGYNVGAVQFRFLSSDVYVPQESLDWAYPFFSNVTDYPLLNEIVLVAPFLNRQYYIAKFNTSNKVTAQPLFGVERLHGEAESTQTTTRKYGASADGGAPIVKNKKASEERLGSTFIENTEIYRLKAQEGDIIYEGRSGHSIRFGSSAENDGAPNLLIRAGQNIQADPSVPSQAGLIEEDLNLDLSSFWMVTDQIISLNFATVDSEIHFRSMEEKPTTLEGNQIIINSDRLLLNSKRDRIFVTSFLGTHFTTLDDYTVDADKNYRSYVTINREIETGQDYVININRDYLLDVVRDKTSTIGGATQHDTVGIHSVRSEKFYLGSLDNENEPLVLGEALRKLLLEFVNAHLDNATAHTLPSIGIGPLSPKTVASLVAVKEQLIQSKEAPFESINAYHPSRDGWEVPTREQE